MLFLQIVKSDYIVLNFFRYTEIWSANEESKIIQLSEPQLDGYKWYPELMIVDTTFCVKP